jgi:hypothetical protein
MTTPEHNEKNEDILNKNSPEKRAVILENARKAKKQKKDVRDLLVKNHTDELANIGSHIAKIYNQINLLVEMIPGKTKRSSESDEDGESAKKQKVGDKEKAVDITPMVTNVPNPAPVGTFSYEFSEMLGKVVGSFAVAGGLYMIKSYLAPVRNNKIHNRYDFFN